jgi:hypothetical protein
MLESPIEEKISRRPITEIRLHDDEIFTLELGTISLSKLFDDMQTQCTQKYITSTSIALQWFPSVLPPSITMPPFLFNPAVLPLPAGSLYRYLAVSRSNYDAELHKIVHPSFPKQFSSVFWGILLACLMDEDFTCAHIPRELHLYYPIEGIAQRYNQSSNFPHTMAGAEDPRLLWSETNAPLLLYGMNALESNNNTLSTRVVWMIDIRHVFQALNVILPKSYSQIPFYTNDQGVELNYHPTLWEKNWMVFIHQSQMLIGYSITPKVTIRRQQKFSIEDSRRWFFDIIAVSENTVRRYYLENKYEKILQINDDERVGLDAMHQGPNALLIVTEQSTFYFTIIHQRAKIYDRVKGFQKSHHYMHYTALFDTELPYRWLEVSRQHIDPILSDQLSVSERQRQFIFVTTIAFNDQVDIENGYGTLNSRIVVSYGLVDLRSYIWVGTLSDLMNNMREALY